MDQVPVIFRERVASFWKCCEQTYCARCYKRRQIPDCEWTAISKKERLAFSIGTHHGEWKYGFQKSVRNAPVTIGALKAGSNLKHTVISEINFFEDMGILMCDFQRLDVDIEVLMKFVVSLCNEPLLSLAATVKTFYSPKGQTIIRWFGEMWYSEISIHFYEANCNRLVEKQFSRRKVTPITVSSLNSGKEFLENELASLRLQNFRFRELSRAFSSEVLREIVGRFIETPSQFDENYKVQCPFDGQGVKNFMETMERTELRTYDPRYIVQSHRGPGNLEISTCILSKKIYLCTIFGVLFG